MKSIPFLGLMIAATGCAQTRVDLQTQSRNVDFSKAGTTKPAKTGTVLPAVCGAGELFINLSAPNGAGLYVCSSANIWSLATTNSSGGGSGGAATSISTATVGALPAQCSIGDVRFAGDAAIGGGGFYLYFCTAVNTWTQFGYVGGGSGALNSNCSSLPCTIDVSYMVPLKGAANTWMGANDFSGASKTAPFRIGAADPATCDAIAREFFFNTATNTLKACNTANMWTAISGGGGGGPVLGAGGYILPFGLPTSTNVPLYGGDAGRPVVATRFVPDKGGTISNVDMSINTALAAGQGLLVGIYSGDGTTLLAWGQLVAPAAGHVTLVLSSSVTLTAGTSYIQAVASEAEANPAGFSSVGQQGGTFLFSGSTTTNRHWTCASGTTGTGATYALPTSCPPTVSSSYYAITALVLY